VRTDRHNHRPVAGDSELAQAIKLLARAHQGYVWERQRHVNRLRNALREFYPQALAAFGTDLAASDAVAVLSIAPTPDLGRRLSRSKVASALRRAGRQRNVATRAETIQAALRSEQLQAPLRVGRAYGTVVSSLVSLIASLNEQIADLERELKAAFEEHPDAKILRSLPGLGTVLGARVLAEFGDDRTRYADARARKNYAGTSPITKASGARRVVLARFAQTSGSSMLASCGRSLHSPRRPVPGPTTTYSEGAARPTTRRCALSPIVWWGSFMGVCVTASSTTNRPLGPL
jgi:hypothetical protein